VRADVLCLQAAEAELVKNRGVVVNVSSVAGVIAEQSPGFVPYYVAKASQARAARSCAVWLLTARTW
jgi:NAD(P)-dependent dehydrogenase (short-subunit alcohol dehydrogenase family)